MYATAHRVVSPTTGAEGINAFHYLHGGYEWDGPPPPESMPETDPGTLFNDSVAVPPPGNRVRSYLDVVAPDGTPAREIERALADVTSRDVPGSFPAVWTSGRFWFRFGLELALVPVWRQELRLLLENVAAVLGRS
ncbi:MAG: hypothetical protein ABIK85_04065 [Candidatus Eisenbacteria bacterium]